MAEKPITPTREVRVSESDSDTQAGPIIELGEESASSKSYLPAKTILAERWEVTDFLGEGGMSAVYKMRHLAMGRIAAAKVLHPHLSFNDKHLQRFQREAQAASAMSHPNVISIYDCGVTPDGRPFILMEYLAGKSLSDELKENGKLTLERALDIFLSICDGMAHAHEKGVVHRDLKPSNVMLVPDQSKRETTKVVDFGIARVIPKEGADGEAMHQLTQTGEVFGSPLYMSPEQCLGKHPDQRSDIYALGCLMYEVLSGSPPLKGESFLETMHMQMQEVPKPYLKPRIPNSRDKAVEGVVLKCLAKNPADRYGTMQELRKDLAQAARGSSVFGFLKTQAGRELFKRFRSAKKKEINFVRLVSIIAIALVPILFFAVSQFHVVSQFDQISSGVDTMHAQYWQSQRAYLKKKVPTDEEALKLKLLQMSVKAEKLKLAASGITYLQIFTKHMRIVADSLFEGGDYRGAMATMDDLAHEQSKFPEVALPISNLILLQKAKCLYFLGQTQAADQAFSKAFSFAENWSVRDNKIDYLKGFDLYGDMLMRSRQPDYERIAYVYGKAAAWAISADTAAKGTDPNYDFYFLFANLEADAMRVLGDPKDPKERAYVAKYNEVYAGDENILSGTEHKRDKNLGLLKRMSPTLWKTRQVYKEIAEQMNNDNVIVTDLQRCMFWWGKGCTDLKFGIRHSTKELEEALKFVGSAKLKDPKDVESQIRKDIILSRSEPNPIKLFMDKYAAVDVWRSRLVEK